MKFFCPCDGAKHAAPKLSHPASKNRTNVNATQLRLAERALLHDASCLLCTHVRRQLNTVACILSRCFKTAHLNPRSKALQVIDLDALEHVILADPGQDCDCSHKEGCGSDFSQAISGAKKKVAALLSAIHLDEVVQHLQMKDSQQQACASMSMVL